MFFDRFYFLLFFVKNSDFFFISFIFLLLCQIKVDGDIIDCIDINRQPTLDNPLLKNHKIQVRTLIN